MSAHIKCNVGATSINETAFSKIDLWNRTVRVAPVAIRPGEMWQEKEWREKLDACKATILATHLRDMSAVLLRRSTLEVRPISRLSDYETSGEALRIEWGYFKPFSEVLAQNQSKAEDDAYRGDVFLEELIALVHERGKPFVMSASTVLYAVERFWQHRHDKPASMKMDGRPKGEARVGRILSQKASYLHNRGISIVPATRGKTRGYHFSLNHNADTYSIGNNSKAGMNFYGSGEFDEILPPAASVIKTRTAEEWDLLFKELDDTSEAAAAAVSDVVSKAIAGAQGVVQGEDSSQGGGGGEKPPWMSI